MSRYARKRENPPVKPVKRIEVSDKNRKGKLALIVILLALGVTLIAVSVTQMLTTPPGWETIQVSGDISESCAGDFVFLYLLGDGDKAANLEQREITQLYTQAAADAFRLFHEEKLFDGVHNVAYLNRHPNEEVEIPAALYAAFSLFEESGNRALYAAPLYREYVGLFMSEEDWAAKMYDPNQSQEQADYFREVLAFTTDENAVSLKLLGNNRVKLQVSEAYLHYAAEKEIAAFIDFYWMKNAFVADYLADAMIGSGYTKGTISSFDGFSRNLDSSDRSYELNIFNREKDNIFLAGAMSYSGVKSFVSLRNYPMSDLAVQLYYRWADGSYTSCHIDPADGLSKSAINDFTGYSRSLSCGEVLMSLYGVFVADSLDMDAVENLPQKGVETVYCQNRGIITSDPAVKISGLYNKDGVSYTWLSTK